MISLRGDVLAHLAASRAALIAPPAPFVQAPIAFTLNGRLLTIGPLHVSLRIRRTPFKILEPPVPALAP